MKHNVHAQEIRCCVEVRRAVKIGETADLMDAGHVKGVLVNYRE